MWRAGPRLADSRVVAGRSHAVDGVNEVGRQSSPMPRRPDASPQVSALYQQFHTATSGFDSRHLHCPGLRSRRSGDIKAAIPLATGGGLRVSDHRHSGSPRVDACSVFGASRTPNTSRMLDPWTAEQMRRSRSWKLSLIHISEPTRLGMISYAV